MRVFVTGASGHVGSALVPELLAAGRQVVALARADTAADGLTAAGPQAARAALDALGGLAAAAAVADGVIPPRFNHAALFAGEFDTAVAAVLRAIDTLGDALAGTGKPLVTTS